LEIVPLDHGFDAVNRLEARSGVTLTANRRSRQIAAFRPHRLQHVKSVQGSALELIGGDGHLCGGTLGGCESWVVLV
jgi:hypothetical protein